MAFAIPPPYLYFIAAGEGISVAGVPQGATNPADNATIQIV